MSLLFSFEMVKIVYFIEQAVESQVMPQSAMRFFSVWFHIFGHIATDVPWSVCLLVTSVSPAKTAKLIEMPFGLWTWVGPRNHVLGGSQDPPRGRGNFGGPCSSPL